MPSSAAPKQRIICRFHPSEDTDLVFEFAAIAERFEMPEFGEEVEMLARPTNCGLLHMVRFRVSDVHCSDESEDFVFVEVAMEPVEIAE
jgi:hypothetical protein